MVAEAQANAERLQNATITPNALWHDCSLTMAEKAIYSVIKSHDWGDGYVLSLALIAAEAGCKTRKARLTLRSLETRAMVRGDAQVGGATRYFALPLATWTPACGA